MEKALSQGMRQAGKTEAEGKIELRPPRPLCHQALLVSVRSFTFGLKAQD